MEVVDFIKEIILNVLSRRLFDLDLSVSLNVPFEGFSFTFISTHYNNQNSKPFKHTRSEIFLQIFLQIVFNL